MEDWMIDTTKIDVNECNIIFKELGINTKEEWDNFLEPFMQKTNIEDWKVVSDAMNVFMSKRVEDPETLPSQ